MNDEKKFFMFYRVWREQLKELPDAERLQMYDAIADYAFTHTAIDFVYYLNAIMKPIRDKIDEDDKRYMAFINKQRANGAMGGRPPKDKTAGNPQEPKKPMGSAGNPQEPKKPKCKGNDKGNSNGNGELVEGAKAPLSPNGDAVAKATRGAPIFDLKKFAEMWNERMKDTEIPQITKLSDRRKAWLTARLNEYGEEAVSKVIESTAASSFLNGGGGRGFKADFDWVFRPNNFPKILEGNYDNNPITIPTQHGTRSNSLNGSGTSRQGYSEKAAADAAVLSDCQATVLRLKQGVERPKPNF